MLDLNTVKPNQVVYPATENDAVRLGNALGSRVSTKTPFRILVVVKDGVDYKGKAAKGVIVAPVAGNVGFPFVWNVKKFDLPEVSDPAEAPNAPVTGGYPIAG